MLSIPSEISATGVGMEFQLKLEVHAQMNRIFYFQDNWMNERNNERMNEWRSLANFIPRTFCQLDLIYDWCCMIQCDEIAARRREDACLACRTLYGWHIAHCTRPSVLSERLIAVRSFVFLFRKYNTLDALITASAAVLDHPQHCCKLDSTNFSSCNGNGNSDSDSQNKVNDELVQQARARTICFVRFWLPSNCEVNSEPSRLLLLWFSDACSPNAADCRRSLPNAACYIDRNAMTLGNFIMNSQCRIFAPFLCLSSSCFTSWRL